MWGADCEGGDGSREMGEEAAESPDRKGWKLNQSGSREGRDGWIRDMILRSQIRKPGNFLRTVDLCTSGQRWERSRTQETWLPA